jgi:pimeloyl-ACP methyl ester carboxylesterase
MDATIEHSSDREHLRSERVEQLSGTHTGSRHRARLLAGLPVAERRLQLAGVSTAVLEGGAGPPLVLLHGPGEFARMWMRVIPELATTHRVIAPDLPGHGTSVAGRRLDADGIRAWLRGLIERTCSAPPVLVGHVLGGAIAARFALNHSQRLSRLVLGDSLGLARFRPTPQFAITMIAFLMRPTERAYTRFMRQRSLREVRLPQSPPDDLARIVVPTVLIWGRHDRANRLRIAEIASHRYGWPLHVIENCADDPPRDQPRAFLDALGVALGTERSPRVIANRRPL